MLGLRKSDLLRTVDELTICLRDAGDDQFFDTCELLWSGATREEQFVASSLLSKRRSALALRPWATLSRWLDKVAREQVENWLRTGTRSDLAPQEWRIPGR